jgi:hypothetical protein
MVRFFSHRLPLSEPPERVIRVPKMMAFTIFQRSRVVGNQSFPWDESETSEDARATLDHNFLTARYT